MQFIDTARVYLKAGKGGDGCLSFRREKYIPRGGPDGGNGGKGGDIYLKADSDMSTLLDLALHSRRSAGNGGHGQGSNKNGKNGEDITIYVPCGTVVKRGERVVADFIQPDQKVLIAQGGRGGRGNASFKSNQYKAPRIAEKGELGEEIAIDLELKVLADVGLVGFPNAGKSTFLARVSRARPKIAEYPFTTLSPQLGLVRHKEKSFVLADIPGLIEGAHTGKGLGIQFLKHLERTRVLIHLVDPSGFGGVEPVQGIRVLERELKEFSSALYKKPRFLAVNKMDLSVAALELKKIKSKRRGWKIFGISAVTGSGVEKVLDEVLRFLSQSKPSAVSGVAIEEKSGMEKEFVVRKVESHVFEVCGRSVERLVSMTRFGLPEALRRFQGILKKMGVDRELRRCGIQSGDEVRIGTQELEWRPEDSAS
ncbi:MAG: GTPase ObgE [Elusimicrobia bacterium]|nr:GTPase ObgE [Elusimicrobiota bacterium]